MGVYVGAHGRGWGRMCKREHGRMGAHEADMGACGGCMNAPAKGVIKIKLSLTRPCRCSTRGSAKCLPRRLPTGIS